MDLNPSLAELRGRDILLGMKALLPIPLWLRSTSTIVVVSVLAFNSISATKEKPQVKAAAVASSTETIAPENKSESIERLNAPSTLAPTPDTVLPRTPIVRLVWMEVTAYCPCIKCCGPKASGLTASGKDISYNAGRFVAADTKQLPFGTKLIVPGYGDARPVEVIDRGGAIKGNRLDVFFPTHQEALNWGRRFLAVAVIE